MPASDEADRKAFELRKAGAPADRIADALDEFTSADEVQASLQRSLSTVGADERKDAVKLELARLDALQRALWPSAMQGKWLAVDRCLQIMERRARLLGLDGTPVEPEKPQKDGVNDIEEQRKRRRARVAASADLSRS